MIIKAGTYRFNDMLSIPSSDMSQAIDFTGELNLTEDEYASIFDSLNRPGEDLTNFKKSSVYSATGFGLEIWGVNSFSLHYLVSSSSSYIISVEDGIVYIPRGTDIYIGDYDNGNSDWYFPAQTITIPNDSEVSAEFYAWFTANAVLQGGEDETPVASIQYSGSTIVSLEAGQTATLKCKGKVMKTDVVVEVDEQEEPILQEKTATENGEVVPDTGYDGLSKVVVDVQNRAEEWFNDGNTHLWIHLTKMRTSPRVGVCPNGTVTVDWGDGTTPDVLTGTSVEEVKYTPNHHYDEPGDYVITLTVDGEMGISMDLNSYSPALLSYSAYNGNVNMYYMTTLRRVEIGNGVSIGESAFSFSNNLANVKIPNSVKSISSGAFDQCHALTNIVLPKSVTSIEDWTFSGCTGITSIIIPNNVTRIGSSAFDGCNITFLSIPSSVTSIGDGAFSGYGLSVLDFTEHIAVPNLEGSLGMVPDDLEIRVKVTLCQEWQSAPNWSQYANNIEPW